MSNAVGEWSAPAPGKTTVSTDASPLQVRCVDGEGRARGEASVSADVRGGRWRGALIGGGAGGTIGWFLGHQDDRRCKEPNWCFGLGGVVGAIFGTAIGAGVGAASAELVYDYPSKVRVVLQPDSPSR